MPKEYGRDQRVADFIQRELATVLQSEMRDPRVAMVSINEVRCLEIWAMQTSTSHPYRPGMRLGRSAVVKALAGAAGFLRTALAKRSKFELRPACAFTGIAYRNVLAL